MSGKTRVLAVAGSVILVGLVWVARVRPERTEEPPGPEPEVADFRPPGPPGEPHRELDADRRMSRVAHKDANGLSPLELINTPQGLVTVQRTFRTDGTLLKEEAFLDGKSVPVPSRGTDSR